jgi:hypothetical protein
VRRLQQVIVTHQSDWGLHNRAEVESRRRVETFHLDHGEVLEVESRYWSPYWAFDALGEAPPLPFAHTDNTKQPSQRVMSKQAEELSALGKECDVLLWMHAFACYPQVAQQLKSVFKQSLLYFGDDCPGSSEIKTFPVARYFDALVYSMYVWNGDSGERAAARYAKEGLSRSYWYPMVTTVGLDAWVSDKSFDALSNAPRSIDLVWVGNAGFTIKRQLATRQLDRARQMAEDLRIMLYGFAMPHGELEGRTGPAPGRTVANLYSHSLCGANVAESSIFNTRLLDLWAMGVVQIVCDAHGELPEFGFVAGRHYLPWDGSAEHLLDHVRWCKANPAAIERIRLDASTQRRAFATKYNRDAAMTRAYADSLK